MERSLFSGKEWKELLLILIVDARKWNCEIERRYFLFRVLPFRFEWKDSKLSSLLPISSTRMSNVGKEEQIWIQMWPAKRMTEWCSNWTLSSSSSWTSSILSPEECNNPFLCPSLVLSFTRVLFLLLFMLPCVILFSGKDQIRIHEQRTGTKRKWNNALHPEEKFQVYIFAGKSRFETRKWKKRKK